ncbi:Transcriptional repressor tup11-related protein [Histomonas meleagridis]|uniref:Transcriptional repressor tup11-related protein n=1 Tax=Histomonas meleagridis TaxID=135588 RepID=UPI00355999E9|nr:Transcriptional repressor tup11-related protein [Histomonas meleagridis]KAH0798523.1 Transcriptional repressor tup11-related protein [Histomonas meleagridis]
MALLLTYKKRSLKIVQKTKDLVRQMSFLNSANMKQLLEQLASEYELLVNNRTKLENDCNRLKDYIDSQVTQIQSLNNDFEKLRQDFIQKGGEQLLKQSGETSDHQNEEEQTTQDWELTTLAPPKSIRKPYIISLIAEILDVSVICSTAFSPDGTYIAIGSDKAIRVYDIEKDTFQFQETIENETEVSHIRSISWAGNDTVVSCGEDGHIRVYQIIENKLLKDFVAAEGGVFQVQVTNDNKFIAALTNDGSLVLFSMEDFSEISRMKKPTNEGEEEAIAVSMTISPDDKIIAVSYNDFSLVLWDKEKKEILTSKKCHDDSIQSIVFIPNSNRIATGSLDCTIKIWEVQQEEGKFELELYKLIKGHDDFVLSLAVDNKGEWLLSGSKDMTARLIDLSNCQMIYGIKGHTNSVISVGFNKSSSLFCTGSGDRSVKIWSFNPEETEEI